MRSSLMACLACCAHTNLFCHADVWVSAVEWRDIGTEKSSKRDISSEWMSNITPYAFDAVRQLSSRSRRKMARERNLLYRLMMFALMVQEFYKSRRRMPSSLGLLRQSCVVNFKITSIWTAYVLSTWYIYMVFSHVDNLNYVKYCKYLSISTSLPVSKKSQIERYCNDIFNNM